MATGAAKENKTLIFHSETLTQDVFVCFLFLRLWKKKYFLEMFKKYSHKNFRNHASFYLLFYFIYFTTTSFNIRWSRLQYGSTLCRHSRAKEAENTRTLYTATSNAPLRTPEDTHDFGYTVGIKREKAACRGKITYKNTPAAKSFNSHNRGGKLRERITFIMQFPIEPSSKESMMKSFV